MKESFFRLFFLTVVMLLLSPHILACSEFIAMGCGMVAADNLFFGVLSNPTASFKNTAGIQVFSSNIGYGGLLSIKDLFSIGYTQIYPVENILYYEKKVVSVSGYLPYDIGLGVSFSKKADEYSEHHRGAVLDFGIKKLLSFKGASGMLNNLSFGLAFVSPVTIDSWKFYKNSDMETNLCAGFNYSLFLNSIDMLYSSFLTKLSIDMQVSGLDDHYRITSTYGVEGVFCDIFTLRLGSSGSSFFSMQLGAGAKITLEKFNPKFKGISIGSNIAVDINSFDIDNISLRSPYAGGGFFLDAGLTWISK